MYGLLSLGSSSLGRMLRTGSLPVDEEKVGRDRSRPKTRSKHESDRFCLKQKRFMPMASIPAVHLGVDYSASQKPCPQPVRTKHMFAGLSCHDRHESMRLPLNALNIQSAQLLKHPTRFPLSAFPQRNDALRLVQGKV